MATNGVDDANSVPSVSTAAVLKQSVEMPQNAQKIEELNFDDSAGRSITVEDLINGTSNIGFKPVQSVNDTRRRGRQRV